MKTKYQFAANLREAGILVREKKFDEAQAVSDKLLAASGIGPEQLQQCWFYKGMFYQQAKDSVKAVESFQKALDADPEGRTATTIRLLMQQAQKRRSRPRRRRRRQNERLDIARLADVTSLTVGELVRCLFVPIVAVAGGRQTQ